MFTAQIKTVKGWQTFWSMAESRADVLDDLIDNELGFETAYSHRIAPMLIRPAAYKEWISDPACGCVTCKNKRNLVN